MQCGCGEETTTSQHEVKTLAKAQEWSGDIKECELPIKIYQDICKSCGRRDFQIEVSNQKHE